MDADAPSTHPTPAVVRLPRLKLLPDKSDLSVLYVRTGLRLGLFSVPPKAPPSNDPPKAKSPDLELARSLVRVAKALPLPRAATNLMNHGAAEFAQSRKREVCRLVMEYYRAVLRMLRLELALDQARAVEGLALGRPYTPQDAVVARALRELGDLPALDAQQVQDDLRIITAAAAKAHAARDAAELSLNEHGGPYTLIVSKDKPPEPLPTDVSANDLQLMTASYDRARAAAPLPSYGPYESRGAHLTREEREVVISLLMSQREFKMRITANMLTEWELALEQAKALEALSLGKPYTQNALVARAVRERFGAVKPGALNTELAQRDVQNISRRVAHLRRECALFEVDMAILEQQRSRRAVRWQPWALAACGALAALAALRHLAARRGRLAALGAQPLRIPLSDAILGARVAMPPNAPRHAAEPRRGQLGTVTAVTDADAAGGTLCVRWDRDGESSDVPATSLREISPKRALLPVDVAPGVRVCRRAGGAAGAERYGTVLGAAPLLRIFAPLAAALGPLLRVLRAGDDGVVRVRWDDERVPERVGCRELAWCGIELRAQRHGAAGPGEGPPMQLPPAPAQRAGRRARRQPAAAAAAPRNVAPAGAALAPAGAEEAAAEPPPPAPLAADGSA